VELGLSDVNRDKGRKLAFVFQNATADCLGPLAQNVRRCHWHLEGDASADIESRNRPLHWKWSALTALTMPSSRGSCSGGMQMRARIARATDHRTHRMLMDEPLRHSTRMNRNQGSTTMYSSSAEKTAGPHRPLSPTQRL